MHWISLTCIHDPHPPRTEYTVEEFENGPDGDPPDESCFEAVDHLVAELGEDRYIPSLVSTTAVVLLGGTENGLMMYALRPEVVRAAAAARVRSQNAADAINVRPGTAGVMFSQDMAGTNGPLVSPAMFRDMCLPYFKQRMEHVRRYRDQVLLHNCGNNIPLMEMFIEAGLDCYQSLQTTAGMEVGRLKEMFGHRLCFWGGVGVEVLITGSPDDVRGQVRTAMQRGAPAGGFILGPSHSIAMNTPYENFMVLLEEFTKLRDKFY